MKINTIIKNIGVVALAFSAFFAAHAFAMTPTLSLTNNGGSVQLSVYGDPNSSVTLEYSSGYGYQTTGILGYTNGSGYYSSTLNTYSYPITSGQQVYALVDNQESSSTIWPYTSNYGYTNYGYGSLSLSQTSLTLTQGQSQSVSTYDGSGTLYVSSDSNPSVATGTVYGSQISVNALNEGSTTLEICSNNGGCASLYVSVTYSNNNYQYGYGTGYGTNYQTYPYTYTTSTPVTLSQSDLTLAQGQSESISIYGSNTYAYNTYGSSNYYIYSYTNPGTISPYISGNTLTIYGTASGSGNVTVCPTSNGSTYGSSNCATVYVTVNGYNNYNTYPYTGYQTYPYTYNTYY